MVKQSSLIYGRGSLSAATPFVPVGLTDYLKSLAKAPKAVVNRLQFTTAKAQLLAFKRWKGCYELPEIEEFTGILENDVDQMVSYEDKKHEVLQVLPRSNKCAENEMFLTKGTSYKRKNLVAECQRKKRQCGMQLIPTISSCFSNDKPSRQRSTPQKYPPVDEMLSKMVMVAETPMKTSLLLKSIAGFFVNFRNSICLENNSMLSNEELTGNFNEEDVFDAFMLQGKEPRRQRSTPQDYSPVDEMFSKMIIVAETPMKNCTRLETIAGFFLNFRNSICLENNMQRNEKLAGNLQGREDSYWTDKMIQNNLEDQVHLEHHTQIEQDQVHLEYHTQIEQDTLIYESERLDVNLEQPEACGFETPIENATQPQGLDNNAMVSDAGTLNLPHVDENSVEYSPTLLILNFKKLESIPSLEDLNKIFTKYGPLHEMDTEILYRSKRAKMFFKRRSDADAAFNNVREYNIFGPSLISYRLKILPNTYKASSASKTKRKKNVIGVIQNDM